MKNILAISGSLRTKSANLTIIESIAEMFADKVSMTIYQGLANLPHFNPDLDTDAPPAEVKDFRDRIKEADCVLICSPEYVFSVPGALKNALEWTVSSSDFSGKPTALITASSLGEKAHESLFLVLKTIEAKIDEKTSLLISGARTKLDEKGKFSDNETLESVTLLIDVLINNIENQTSSNQ